MSDRGVKRPVSDDQNSPECLFPAQPLTDRYASDEMNETTQNQPENSVILSRHSKSTYFSGPEVLFFFDLTYKPQPPPVDLADLSVVGVLEQILKFLYQDKDGDHQDKFTKSGRSVPEIYSFYLKKFKWLSWMNDNDDLNLKQCTTDEFWKKDRYILKYAQEEKEETLNALSQFLWFLHSEYQENECKNRESWKHVFWHIQRMIPLLGLTDTPKSACFISLSRGAVFDYKVPTTLVSAVSSPRIAHISDVTIHRDAVYGNRYRQHHNFLTVPKIVIEVYRPTKGSSRSKDQLQKLETDKEKRKKMKSAFVDKPKRKTDSILSASYMNEAYEYLRQSIPEGCGDVHTTTQLTAQHALSLIGIADEQSRQLRKLEHKHLSHHQTNLKNPVYKPIGMFLKNEHIFFSKLKITDDRLLSFSKPGAYRVTDLEEGTVSFSHWRLDLMEPNHRIALIVALIEILQTEEMI